MEESAKLRSARRLLADRIADFIGEQRFGGPYGGDVHSHGRYYSIGFSVNGLLDGEVRVYGVTFIQVTARGRLALSSSGDSAVFDNEENAKDYVRLAYVKHDREAAVAVPTKPARSNGGKS